MDAKHSDWPSARALVEWRERRRRYIALYQRKLAVLKHTASSSNMQKQVRLHTGHRDLCIIKKELQMRRGPHAATLDISGLFRCDRVAGIMASNTRTSEALCAQATMAMNAAQGYSLVELKALSVDTKHCSNKSAVCAGFQ